MTEKIYYEDPYIQTFQAEIIHQTQDENGQEYVVLNKTAFYPTGGGQPHDTGTLNGVPVVNVVEVGGEVRHYIESRLEEKEIVGEINWERRFDHMQQHAGQHILSAAFENMFDYKTISFHLGAEVCSIDLNVAKLTEEITRQVEEKTNAIILENHPIETKWVTEEEANQYPLRKALSVTDHVRLVIIPDFDYNGCGGTHPSATGQVSAIKILHWEKEKKNTVRVYFVCGNRVLKQLHEKHEVIQRLTVIHNVPQEELEVAAKRIRDEKKSLEKRIQELKLELLENEANSLVEQATLWNEYKLVKNVFSDKTMSELQQMAKHIIQHNENVITILLNEKDEKFQLVMARSNNGDINMQEVMKKILPAINGKGGGNKNIAQGGGDATLSSEALIERILQAFTGDDLPS